MNNTTYKTKQKEALLNFLEKNKDTHFTVEDIMYHLKDMKTSIGKTTIYRTLELLEEQGSIKKYPVAGSSACYQYVGEHMECHLHYHLKCVVCNALFHISSKELDKVSKVILKSNDFKVDNSKTILYGTCKDCLNNSNEKEVLI